MSMLALAALLGWAVHRVRVTQREQRRSQALPKPLQVWEDEGGQNQMPDAPPEPPAAGGTATPF